MTLMMMMMVADDADDIDEDDIAADDDNEDNDDTAAANGLCFSITSQYRHDQQHITFFHISVLTIFFSCW